MTTQTTTKTAPGRQKDGYIEKMEREIAHWQKVNAHKYAFAKAQAIDHYRKAINEAKELLS